MSGRQAARAAADLRLDPGPTTTPVFTAGRTAAAGPVVPGTGDAGRPGGPGRPPGAAPG